MAVTNSLFMLACPPLFHCESARRTAPTTKEVGATHFVSVASDDGSVWPCRRQVYHSGAPLLPGFYDALTGGSTHLPWRRIRSTRRPSASASGTAFSTTSLPTYR